MQNNFCEFSFDSFDILLSENKIIFHYSVDHLYFFDPEYEITLESVKDKKEIEYEVFNFGLAEIPSFYKTFCTKSILINAGYLNDKQIKFWTNLYCKGLGEFFYRNKIDFR